jgi:membrane-associated phospholipid phosphatase
MELNILLWLQSLATWWLDWIMGGITYLGSEYFYLAALCLLYWCVEVRGTLRLFVVFMSSVYLGGAIKELVGALRPFQAYPNLIHARFVETAPDPSFPSAHAMDSVIFWGYLCLVFRKRWLYIITPILVVLIALSRLYLGLHWPLDVLGGLVLGLLVLGFAYLILRLLAGTPIQARFPVTLLLCLAPLLFFVLLPSHGGAQTMGVLFGCILGYQLERRYISFPVRLPAWKQAIKLVLGLAGAIAILVGLGGVLSPLAVTPEVVRNIPGEATSMPAWGGFLYGWGNELPVLLHYTLVGLWCTLAAPGLFRLIFGKEKQSTPS